MKSTSDTSSTLSIAIVRQRYNPFGGAERFVERALAALSEQNMRVTLITRQWDGAEASAQNVLLCKPFHIGRLWRDWAFARSVQRAMAQNKFDLVQSHERIAGCDIFRAGDGIHAAWLEQRARAIGSFSRLMQRISPWHRYTLAAESAMFLDARLKAVICNSEMVRKDIAQRFPSITHKLHVVHNGVDLARFHPEARAQHREAVRGQLGVSEQTPVIVYVGSGFARKGVPQLLEALREAVLKDAHLWVIGKDRAESKLKKRAQAYGLSDRVHFLGAQKDVVPYLAAADAFALPTLYDPMPNAALEALACGLPVLTSHTSGAAELITAENGVVTDALEIPAIAHGLAQLLSQAADPNQREIQSRAARQAVQDLSTQDMAVRQIALYRTLLTGLTQTKPL